MSVKVNDSVFSYKYEYMKPGFREVMRRSFAPRAMLFFVKCAFMMMSRADFL